MTAGGSSLPEVQALLRVLATGRRRAAEIGTAFGDGALAISEELAPGGMLVTVEIDADRAQVARAALGDRDGVRLLEGDWRRELPPYAPFDFLFVDGGSAKTDPLVLELLEPGGLAVIDDLTPGHAGADPVRSFWLENDGLVGVEIMTTPSSAAIVAARRA
jgi:predicted O-methyltransferase YrrM